MASPNAGTTFGATIVPPPNRRSHEPMLLPPTSHESPALMPAVSHDSAMPPAPAEDGQANGVADKPISPFSCFYQHPPASFERVHSRTTSKTNLGISEKDLESGAVTPLSLADENPFAAPAAAAAAEDKMWPSRQTLLLARKAEKCKRRQNGGCAPLRNRWSRCSKTQKLWAKIVLALVLVGVAVGVGVGISVAVHGTYYASKGNSDEIGQT